MRTRPRASVALGLTLALAPLLTASLVLPGHTAPEPRRGVGREVDSNAAAVAVAWQRIAVRTVYTEGALAPPVGSLYLSFTSLAVHDAAGEALQRGHTSETAAVATAAHDVLWEYFKSPASRANLDADLAASLATVPDGPAEAKGVRLGRAAAARMIASRVGDGRDNASIVYSKPEAIGIWQPVPGGAMAAAWLGFVRPVVLDSTVPVDGPDALGSAAYAADYNEVRRLGSTASAERTQAQKDIALFFANNPVSMYRSALCTYLDAHPLGLLATTRLFARIDAAQSDTFIRTWRLKYDLGYWRPFQAIARAADDGNPATAPQPGWTPLVANPAYSDYPSGHGSATAAFAEVVRLTLGESTPLLLKAGLLERPYANLSALEHDALHARIWGGLHFRDGMEDTYVLGHETAHRVMTLID
ncbi:hypothetical protein DDE18_01550 [Nocardioides gansuensis]|uniref:Phosphatidic acid phosphatase type 2/haloperoxidase domain-containing protein n=1 Tax=Nocardioides gansuensis TaxID=2138300 RepID=A0A2T8FF51_9ACTN|nr:vanadium-dependent haloperoxidase [Nocardioides gansuensis]PVG84336.1 hypothetical protein DDE18_01550 [Nocardioides gansuensis]